MSVGAITAGEAYVSVTCDNSGLVAGLREASSAITSTARKIASMEDDLTVNVGVEGVDALEKSLRRVESAVGDVVKEVKESAASATVFATGFFPAIKNAISSATQALGEFGDAFDKMSGRTGISTETLSEYAHAAAMCGADISNVEGALKGMSRYLDDAAIKGGDAKAAFDRLGLSATELLVASPERQFETIAAAIARIEEPTERAALAMKIFGDDGQKLLPLFSSGADGLQAMKEEARTLGVSLSGEAAAGGAAFVDATTRLQTAVHGAGLAFAELFAPALTSIANGLSKVVSKIATFARECPVLSGGIALVVGAFGALATAATTWNVVGAAVGSSLTALGKTFGLLKVAAVASCKGIATALSLLSAHPVLAVVAAIGTAVVALKGYQAVRDAALGRNAWGDEAAQALEAGNAMREQDEGRLARLQELAEKQELTKTEIAEAVSLAAELKSRYGDVGVEVDALTGKIKIASGAQAELNKRMLEARRKETQAALDEAKANGADGVIERKIAEEEVGWDEALIGKKRGQSWSDWAFKDWSWHDSTADAKVAIASGDKNYQAKVAAAKAKNAAEIEKLEAELAGFDAVLNAPEGAASAPGTSGGSSGEASGVAAADGKIAEFLEASAERVEDADLSPFDRKRDEIRDRGEALKDEMRKALDPDGVVDWSNADSIWNFLSSRPDGAAQIEAFNARSAQIDAATNAELAGVDEEERKKANEDAAKAAQEAAKKEEAALKSVADFEARRAEEGKTNAEKRIDAIRKETAEYKAQLQTLLDLEKAKPEGKRDAAKVAELEGKIASVDAGGKEREGAVLAEAQEAYFEKFATPFEKYEKAQTELTQALDALRTAQKSGDKATLAAAYERLGVAREKYESAESAVAQKESAAESAAFSPAERVADGIAAKIETGSVGTFSAFQAEALAAGYDRKLYEQSRRQTRLLENIERKTGVATFS